GSNYLLETAKNKILVDCGLFQGLSEMEKKNLEPFPYNPKEIDFVFITHAHLDHIGRLPKLVKDGFNGRIFATRPTIDFARLMLEDSQKVFGKRMSQIKHLAQMNGEQIEKLMEMFQPAEYDALIEVNGEISVCFREAGHVLGSAAVELSITGKKIVFSGDLGSTKTSILKDPAKIEQADYIVMESTYGDRFHESNQQCKSTIENVTEETVTKKGVLMIPSFSLERTQQLLYHFNELVENNRIPPLPIFIDSPLAIRLTEVYSRYSQYYDEEAKSLLKSGDDIFKFPGLKLTLTTAESKAINDVPPPKIIIAGSGMSQGGRIVHHETRYLPGSENTLLIVAYQARGTLGRKILDGADSVKIMGEIVPVRAKVERVDCYSSHGDQDDLLWWLSNIAQSGADRKIRKVFICHGEDDSSLALSRKIRNDFGLKTEIPHLGEVVEL
ncbi:MBL fold metallo-hydrolase, partial [Patescibacteria group bacterium]|nr:MBL fold metallo-hydrolase [Patescibacteria group bacterium]